MKTEERECKPEIKSITYLSGKTIVECAQGQIFYQTPKAFEIWNVRPLFLVKRISRAKIGWVNTY